ncbi:DNA polymerase III subunit beta [Paludicola sp. MB14-C6]|uniref:DNA polymerase III subunit beta n=1 Tax=Paludihabitans sp. MB14-C6 TaxID=3070656 RepID=UPI0027DB9917|nr:DNA polymerase III subunit beta [Paludicola sp. MB14-C6]WMJ21789.1 DNA polymerase III subunit beta [Paludicola sp. MB14-C6]
MKFTCEKSLLSEAINNVIPAVSSKSTLIALEGILLCCKDNTLNITGYNLELGIIKKIDVSAHENGNIILNASLLSNIINKMPEGIISFQTDEKLLTIIRCKDVEFTILGLDAEEYPDMPTISDDKQLEIPHFLLRKMISQTLFSVAQTDQNPIHTGSLFDIDNGILNIVSVDGYRLAMRKEKVPVTDNFKFVVPGKTLGEIVKLISRLALEDDEEKVKITVSNKHISFTINGYVIISRLLEGEFLDYKNAIPNDSQTEIITDTKIFLDSINRASIIINERAKSPIKCTFENNHIKVFCETAMGKINDAIEAEIEGTTVKIGFNNKYMADALKASECEKIKIQITSPLSPMKIVPIDDDSFLFLVLPVRLK